MYGNLEIILESIFSRLLIFFSFVSEDIFQDFKSVLKKIVN